MYTITCNGKTSEQMGAHVTHRPSITPPEDDLTTVRISGRDSYIVKERYLNPCEISIEMNFRASAAEFESKRSAVNAWLLGCASGSALELSDDDCVYKILDVRIEDFARSLRMHGMFTAVFVVEPYKYLKTGQTDTTMSAVTMTLTNPTEFDAFPVLTYCQATTDASGSRNIQINGNTCSIPESVWKQSSPAIANTVIDVERVCAYRADTFASIPYLNKNGYGGLVLHPGANTLYSVNRTKWMVRPNWRVRI